VRATTGEVVGAEVLAGVKVTAVEEAPGAGEVASSTPGSWVRRRGPPGRRGVDVIYLDMVIGLAWSWRHRRVRSAKAQHGRGG
jgi:hypothetical protein